MCGLLQYAERFYKRYDYKRLLNNHEYGREKDISL